jgi:hypothetical protein
VRLKRFYEFSIRLGECMFIIFMSHVCKFCFAIWQGSRKNCAYCKMFHKHSVSYMAIDGPQLLLFSFLSIHCDVSSPRVIDTLGVSLLAHHLYQYMQSRFPFVLFTSLSALHSLLKDGLISERQQILKIQVICQFGWNCDKFNIVKYKKTNIAFFP